MKKFALSYIKKHYPLLAEELEGKTHDVQVARLRTIAALKTPNENYGQHQTAETIRDMREFATFILRQIEGSPKEQRPICFTDLPDNHPLFGTPREKE